MGFVTVMQILHDGLDEIKKNPKEFTKAVIDKILNHPNNHLDEDMGIGHHGNQIRVKISHHSDDFVIYVSHGNSLIELSLNEIGNIYKYSDGTLENFKSALKRASSTIKYLEKKLEEFGL